MREYHKIQTMFLRDPKDNYKTLLIGTWAKPEFDYLKDMDWEWTEKFDGVNIRAMWNATTNELSFGGKTNNAQMHMPLLARLAQLFTIEKFAEVFPGDHACIYGEGIGKGIPQSGGYGPVDFVAFDVMIGSDPEKMIWLTRENVIDVCAKLNVQVSPVVGTGGLLAAGEMVKTGFAASIGEREAEGLIMRPSVELRNRYGERVITKIKNQDYK